MRPGPCNSVAHPMLAVDTTGNLPPRHRRTLRCLPTAKVHPCTMSATSTAPLNDPIPQRSDDRVAYWAAARQARRQIASLLTAAGLAESDDSAEEEKFPARPLPPVARPDCVRRHNATATRAECETTVRALQPRALPR